MSAALKEPTGGVLADLAHLADELAEAIANGDMRGARDAHGAIGQGLVSARAEAAVVIDIAARRASRGSGRRRGG